MTAWQEWEQGEENHGKVLANLKTAGLADVLAQFTESGWGALRRDRMILCRAACR